MSMRILTIERMKERLEVIDEILLRLFFYRIVGDDDGGKIFTPEEYEEYKKRVLPMVRINECEVLLSDSLQN